MSPRDDELGAVRVRIARVEDAARIAEIHVRAWQVAYQGIMPQSVLDNLSIPKRQASWEERLASGNATVLVAASGAELIGWLVYGKSRDDDAATGVLEIYGLYVDPRAWRCRVGNRLWEAARRRIAAAGVDAITLWVLAANTRARAFYEAIGFKPEPDRIKAFAREGAILEEIRYRARV